MNSAWHPNPAVLPVRLLTLTETRCSFGYRSRQAGPHAKEAIAPCREDHMACKCLKALLKQGSVAFYPRRLEDCSPCTSFLVHHLLQRYRVSHRLCHWTEKPRRNTESKMSVLEPCPVRTPGGALVSEGTYSLVGSSRCSRVSFLGQGCNARLPP